MTDKGAISDKAGQDEALAKEAAPSPHFADEFGEPELKALKAQVAELKQALQTAQAQADSHWQRLLRKEADLQNTQNRMRKEVENARQFAIDRFAEEILQVLDSLEQGLTFDDEKVQVKDLIEGMALTRTVLTDTLQKRGIKLIEPKAKEAFNPSYHEAISMQPVSEMAPNCIVAVIQKGAMLHERLLRPARVVVSAEEKK